MSGFADDDREITGRNEPFELLMSVADKRASAIGEIKSCRAQLRSLNIRGAMGGDHDAVGIAREIINRSLAHSAGLELFTDDGVMNELAQNR